MSWYSPGALCVFSGVTKVESLTLTPGDHSPALDLGTGGQECLHPLRLLGPVGTKEKLEGTSPTRRHPGEQRHYRKVKTSKVLWLDEDNRKAFSKSPSDCWGQHVPAHLSACPRVVHIHQSPGASSKPPGPDYL